MITDQDFRARGPITASLIIATLMYALDATIANVALPHIQGSVSAAQDEITWVLTSYILGTAVFTPLAGWLSARLGRKRLLLGSIATFTLASMACGLATTLPEIVLFRFLQGVGGAALMPLSQSIILDLYPPKQLTRVMSIWSATIVLGPIVGPTLGGWLVENLSWRWTFYINAPIGLLAFLGLLTFMAPDAGGRHRRFDFTGFVALLVFVVGLQMAVDRGTSQDWFNSREVWAEAILAGAGLYVFVVHSLTGRQPFFHPDLAKDVNFVGSSIFSLFVFGLLFSTSALLPSFMQNLLGYSAMQSGFAAMSRGVGALIAFLSVPWLLTRFPARALLAVGLGFSTLAIWQMSKFDLSMAVQPIVVAGLVQGVGTGLMYAPLNTIAYVTLAPTLRTEATVLAAMARSLGSSIGIAAVQAVLIYDAALAHARLSEGLGLQGPTGALAQIHPAGGAPLAILNAEVTRQATMISYANVFSWMTLGVVVMAPLLLLIRPGRGGGAPEPPME